MTDRADRAVSPRPNDPPGSAAAQRSAATVGRSSGGGVVDGPRLALATIRVGPGLMLVVVVTVVASLSPVFLTTRNIGNVLGQSAVIAVLALAQLLVIVTRGIDLSVGSTLALSAVVGAMVFAKTPNGARW